MKILTLGEVSLTNGSLKQQHQPVILLAYLAFKGPTTRRNLATIFWPEAKNPRNSLSSALTRIRQAAHGATIDDPRTVETPLRTDAHELLELIENGDIEAAVRAYRGDFLEGFELRTVGLELEEWIFSTRESLRSLVKSAAYKLMTAAAAGGRTSDAGEWAERVVDIAPVDMLEGDELDHVFACLVSDGRVRAERLQAEVRLFDRELKAPHDPAPQNNASPVASSELLQTGGPTTLPTKSSTTISNIVGRGLELAELRQNLSAGLSANLNGLGGIGKSTLVNTLIGSQWADEEFAGSIYVIGVNAADDAMSIHEKVASVMNVGPAAPTVSETFMAVESPALVVLEDAQPRNDLQGFLTELIAVPQFSVLIVSRLRIQAEGATNIQISGLESNHSNAPAVTLFLDRARKQLGASEADALDLKDIVAICDRLSGVPLAIELAAAWLSIVPVSDITTMLDDPEILDSLPPGEHLELGRVIERTWSLLGDESQKALSDLAVMDGTFDRTAARSVCEVGLSRLLQLRDHSLLEFLPSGRITLHTLVHAFAARELASDQSRLLELAERHREHFISRLRAATDPDDLNGDAVQRLSDDHCNVVQAWRSLIRTQNWDSLESSLGGIDDYLLRSGNLLAAHQLFSEALTGISAVAGQCPASLVADLCNNLAWVLMLMGRDSEASVLAERGLTDVPAEAVSTRVALLRTRSALQSNAGAIKPMLEGYRQARQLVEPTKDIRLKALLDEDIGRGLSLLGQNGAAIEAFRSTLDAARTINDPHMEARSYLLLANAMVPSEPERSLILCDEGEDLAIRHGLRHLQAYFPRDRGFIFFDTGRFADAELEFARGVSLAEELGDLLIMASLEFGIGRSALRQSDPHRARPHLEQGLRLATRSRQWPDALGATLTLANFVLYDEPHNELARQLFSFCRSHELLSIEDLRRETETEVPVPMSPLESSSRLDETCERALNLMRQTTATNV